MKLKKIKIDGFKSFADKVEIDINDGITAIVGPNGSGKSNILDAVKWVLGDSVKSLRANKIADVIFQGSESRKPLSRASVSLVFDNSDHYLNTEFKEVEIKRVVYSSEESDYFINSSKVRLKDITNLFLDSGAGKEAMNIISQGMIGEVLNSKPEDRRGIIESSAGVLKYKKRKQESLKKLDKTNDNILKIDLIINELLQTLNPLEKQKDKALEYQKLKTRLEEIEITSLVKDISSLSEEKEKLEKVNTDLKGQEQDLKINLSKKDIKVEKLKTKVLALDEKINDKNSELLRKTEEISSLLATKQIISERKKYNVDDLKLEDNIIVLKEKIQKLGIEKNILDGSISGDIRRKESLQEEIESLKANYKTGNANLKKLYNEQSLKIKLVANLTNKLEIIKDNIETNALLPYSVKQILNSFSLKGICGTLSGLIEIDDKYASAINSALSYAQNTIICDTVDDAKNAINYLKDNKLGRASFFPIDVIKPRFIDDQNYELLKKDDDFVDIASNLVKTEKKYSDIVMNQLGSVVVVKNLDALNRVGKLLNYKFKIVSLEGDILYIGGSINGGEKKESKSLITENAKLDSLEYDLATTKENLDVLKKKIEKISSDLMLMDSTIGNKIIEHSRVNLTIQTRKEQLSDLEKQINDLNEELNGTVTRKKGSLDDELNEAIENYYKAVNDKKTIESDLDKLRSEKDSISLDINEAENDHKKDTTIYNSVVTSINKNEIEIGQINIKLDNYIMRLTDEYDMTYEKAVKLYLDKVLSDKERNEINVLRQKIKSLGEVNTGSIEEFNRINERYTFLDKERNDLKVSIDELLGAIDQMDNEMKSRFKVTFDAINNEFGIVFKKLFQGGTGKLVLTDPDDYLTTGIDIIAEPPGKKLKNISFLSGGEKTLTAIALLFAILNVKTVPFCILDEVEAALDEVNALSFGEYLKEYEDKTQFIIITHKKKTMEYANNLYGLTMQEQGISKLVSVKLESE